MENNEQIKQEYLNAIQILIKMYTEENAVIIDSCPLCIVINKYNNEKLSNNRCKGCINCERVRTDGQTLYKNCRPFMTLNKDVHNTIKTGMGTRRAMVWKKVFNILKDMPNEYFSVENFDSTKFDFIEKIDKLIYYTKI